MIMSIDGYGALCLSLSTLVQVFSSGVLKFFGQQQPLSAWQWLFLKSLIGLCLAGGWLISQGRARCLFAHNKEQVIRALIGLLGNWLWIEGVLLTPLYLASILSLTSTFFTTLGAVFFLKERPSQKELMFCALGLLGATVTLYPAAHHLQPSALPLDWRGILYLLGSAICFSTCSLLIKKLSEKEDGWESLCVLLSVLCLGSLPGALHSWEQPSDSTLAAAVVLGCAYVFSQQLIFQAYALARASFIAPFKVLRIPFSIGISGLLFGEIPDLKSAAGCFVILVAYCCLFQTTGTNKTKV